jgi:hypothetical protein
MQARDNFGKIETRRLGKQLGNATAGGLGFVWRHTAPDIAAIAGHHGQGLIEPDIAAAHQQPEDISIVALETLAQQIRCRLVIDARDQEYALIYPMSNASLSPTSAVGFES